VHAYTDMTQQTWGSAAPRSDTMVEVDSESPQISVCVVTYNHDRYIRQCLESLVGQRTNSTYEIIVAEDCSTDSTRSIVHEMVCAYPKRIRVLYSAANLGMWGNYRMAHSAARGHWVMHCDGDDFWHADKIEEQLAFARDHPECAAVFTNSFVIAEAGQVIGTFSSGVPSLIDASYLMARGNFLHHGSLMYRRALQACIIPTREEFIDYEIYLALAQMGPLGFVDCRLTYYRDASTASAIQTKNDRVRELHLKTIARAAASGMSRCTINSARTHFLVSCAIRAIRVRDLALYARWEKHALDKLPASVLHERAKVAASLLHRLLEKIVSSFKTRLIPGQPERRVFYPR
jgi:glycosyltransferase involved in cell wall biosynthesis